MRLALILAIGVAVLIGAQADEGAADGAGLPDTQTVTLQQWAPPPTAAACYRLTDAHFTTGKLCTSQLIKSNTTKVICSEFKPECVQTVEEARMLVPWGTAQTNPAEFNLSAEAACKLLGYRTSGGGSIHVTGDNAAAKTTCWNGREWAQDNWWTTLVCCN